MPSRFLFAAGALALAVQFGCGGPAKKCTSATDCTVAGQQCVAGICQTGGGAGGGGGGGTAGGTAGGSGGGVAGGQGGGSADAGFDAGPQGTGESCTSPLFLTLVPTDGGMTATETVDLTTFADTTTGSCNPHGGPEAVFRIHTTQAQDISLVLSVPSPSTTDPVLYVRSAPCDAGVELVCADQHSGGVTETAVLMNQPAGDYFIFAESWGTPSADAGTGPVTLTVTTTKANAQCSGAVSVPTDGGAVTGTTVGGIDHVQGPCGSSSADVPFLVDTTGLGTRDITATVTPTGTATWRPAVLIRASCSATADLTCSYASGQGTPAATTLLSAAPGQYLIWVDGFNPGDEGPFSLAVTLGAPTPLPANDLCINAQAISGSSTVTGSTIGATNDLQGSCGSGQGDVAYVLDTTGTGAHDISLTVTPDSSTPSYHPVVALRDGCAATVDLGCGAWVSSNATLSLQNLPASRYIIWVGGDTLTDQGRFSLDISVGTPTPPPINDTCLAATALFPDGGTSFSIAGTTRGAASDYSASCSFQQIRDVVYSLTTTTEQKLTVTVAGTGDAGLSTPSLFLNQATCQSDGTFGTTTELGCANAAADRESDRLVVSALPAGSYFLVVDGYNASVGDFTLNATLGPVDGPPSNDTCASPTVLTLAQGSATAEGTTRDAGADFTGATCGASSGDVVYRFNTPSGPLVDGGINARVMIITHNTDEFLPSVFITDPCSVDGGTQRSCGSYNFGSAESVSVALGLAPSSSYDLWVNSPDPLSGPFSVQLDTAGLAANDVCSQAAVLTANTSVAGSTLGANNDYDTYTGGASCGAFPGADVVYTWTSTTAGPTTITVEPQRGFDVALVVAVNTCAASSCVASLDSTSASFPESYSFDATANTTYYIFVDSYADDSHAGNTTTSANGRGGFIVSVSH